MAPELSLNRCINKTRPYTFSIWEGLLRFGYFFVFFYAYAAKLGHLFRYRIWQLHLCLASKRDALILGRASCWKPHADIKPSCKQLCSPCNSPIKPQCRGVLAISLRDEQPNHWHTHKTLSLFCVVSDDPVQRSCSNEVQVQRRTDANNLAIFWQCCSKQDESLSYPVGESEDYSHFLRKERWSHSLKYTTSDPWGDAVRTKQEQRSACGEEIPFSCSSFKDSSINTCRSYSQPCSCHLRTATPALTSY